MATHSGILAWRIPWTEETGGLQSTGSQELDTTEHQHQSTQMRILSLFTRGFPGSSDGKVSAYNVGDLGSIPGSGRSPGEGNENTLQYSCLENPMDQGAWWARVHGVAKSQTQLSDFTSLHLPDKRIEDRKIK